MLPFSPEHSIANIHNSMHGFIEGQAMTQESGNCQVELIPDIPLTVSNMGEVLGEVNGLTGGLPVVNEQLSLFAA